MTSRESQQRRRTTFPGQQVLSRGTVLEGRYEILRVIGQGGMSTVYAARDLRFTQVERLCAVKEMFSRAPNEQSLFTQLATFEREASLLATLSHPAIPKIYDFFTANELIYLVLEFVDGEDLEHLITTALEPVAEDTLIDWSLQILDVLSYLHEYQPDPLVFRDLKPSNIMLRPDGSICLIDFGIARTFEPAKRGTMIGTEGYAPPEQYRGIAEPRGDIYALGASLHHLSTKSDPRSEPPFTFPQRPPRSLNPSLSPEFEQVILRAVAYAPKDRFQSAAAMAQALFEIRAKAAGRPPIGMPGSGAHGIVSEPAHPARSQVEALVAEPSASTDRLLWTIQTADEVRGSCTIGRGLAFIGSYDNHLYAITVRDGGILWRFRANRGIVSKPLVLDELVIAGCEDHRVYGLGAASGRLIWSFRTAMPVRSSATAFGDAAFIGSDDAYCYCLDAKQGHLLWRQRAWGPIRSTPFIHEDNVIFGSDDGTLYCFSAVDGRPRWKTHLGRPVMASPVVLGDTVAAACTDGCVYGVSLIDGSRRWVHQTTAPILASPRIFHDTVYVGSTDGAMHCVSVQDGELRWKRQIASQIISSLAIDGGRGYLGTVDGEMVCLNLGDGETIWTYTLGSIVVSSPAIEDGIVVVGALDGRVFGMRA